MKVIRHVPRYTQGNPSDIIEDRVEEVRTIELRGYRSFYNGEYGPLWKDYARLNGVDGILFSVVTLKRQVIVRDYITDKVKLFGAHIDYLRWEDGMKRVGSFNG